jgi:hypothetical protein
MKNVVKKLAIVLFSFGFLNQQANADVTKTVGASGADFTTLRSAFIAINANTGGVYTGAIVLQIVDNTTETAAAVINTTNTNWTSLLIYPTVAGKTITGNLTTFLIDLNEADNVSIDGRLNLMGQADLTISNTNTNTASRTIRFINDASNNTIKYCNIKGAVASTTAGVILFSTATSGTTGNDNNTIDHCNITNSGSRPYNCIYSAGTASHENSGNIISNNNFYDFINSGATSNCINIAGNSTNWVISGNSFYETANPFVPTADYIYTAININNASGNGFVVSGNYIGGSSAQCGGSALKVNSSTAHLFRGIYINGGTTTATSLQNNTIKNFEYTSTSATPWTGIYINAGSVEVGTTGGNTIGEPSGTGSVSVTTPNAAATSTVSGGAVTGVTLIGGGSGYTTAPAITFYGGGGTGATATATISGGVVTAVNIDNGGSGYTSSPTVRFNGASISRTMGIYSRSAGTVTISYNNIGSITTTGSNYYAHSLWAIFQEVAGGGNMTISNNNIGSSTTNNSLTASSGAAASIGGLDEQEVMGICSKPTSTRTTLITNNTVEGLYNGYDGTTNRYLTAGIFTKGGNNTITTNTVRNISTMSGAYGGDIDATLAGIAQTTIGAGTTQIVNGNTVYNLSNVHSGSGQVDIYGILYYCPPTFGSSTVNGNFIHSLSAVSTNTLSSLDGIVIYSGSPTCANNIITLGNNLTTGYALYGIFEESGNGYSSYLYFNTIYLGGSATGVTSDTYGIFRKLITTGTSTYKNNIFFNNRSGGTTGKHYAIKLSGTTALWDIDWNDYYAPNGVLGKLASGDITTLADWKTGTADDANSLTTNPLFAYAGGTTESDYLTSGSLAGTSITGITTDYFLTTRAATPIMGALEDYNKWTGGTSTAWDAGSNWSTGSAPGASTNALIPDVTNDPVIGETVTASNLAIESGGKLTVAYNGILTVTNGCTNKAGTEGLVLQSTALGTGSFINSSADVQATVERYIAAADWGTWDDGWHNLSSPVVSQAIYPEFVSSYSLGNEDFYKWDEPNNEWINIKSGDGIVNPVFETNFTVGRGYMVAYQQTHTKKFNGILNNADVVMSGLTLTGTSNTNRSWNFLGNPFPCALTWFTDWTTSNIGGVANIWNSAAKSYTPINAGEIIPNGNGFMVSVNNAAGGSLTIPLAKRTTTAANWYKNSDYPVIKLFAKNLDNPSYQESQIRFNPASTTVYDNEYDCDFLAGYAPQFYSVMGDDKLMVNSLPSVSDGTNIPFAFSKNEGSDFSIEVSGLESLPTSAIVYLRDIKLNFEQNVSQNPTYAFTSTEGDDPLRFQIHFGTVGINEQIETSDITAYYNEGKLFLIASTEALEVSIFNVQGQLLYKESVMGHSPQCIPINLPSGIYLAQLKNKEELKIVKFVVK